MKAALDILGLLAIAAVWWLLYMLLREGK